MDNYLAINKQSWNAVVPYHINSNFYCNEKFIVGATSLKSIELALLGDVKGKKVLHLQCHFGQDSISLARMGAEVTAVDFSEKAIAEAKALALQCSVPVEFICADVYHLPDNLLGQFDLVFTTYGVLGWLPNMEQWARVVCGCLNKNGRMILVEFHPVVWMFANDFSHVAYIYFNREAIEEKQMGTYAQPDAPIERHTITWNHSLSDVMQSLINAGCSIEQFDEYDYSPYPCFSQAVPVADDRFMIKGMEGKLPLVYSIVAEKQIG